MTARGVRWGDLEAADPALAGRGRDLLYAAGAGDALLATVDGDAPPRIHPIAIGIVDGGLYAFLLPSAKQRALEADGRYALHAYVDAFHPDEFMVRGRVRPVAAELRAKLAADWPWSVGDSPAYEFLVESAVLAERASRDDWPPRYTAWHVDRG